MKIATIVFPGTNCDRDTIWAFKKLGATAISVWHKEASLPKGVDLVVLPGGFSYGDYLRSAAIAKFSPIMGNVVEFAKKGGLVLGICNGFQLLLEAKLLDGAMKKNESVHFISKYYHLKVINNNNKFLNNCQRGEVLNIPLAHGDGNYYIDDDGLKRLQDQEQILLTYCDEKGDILNPNGSIFSIAGICNKNKNIFGLMPHPERAMEKSLGSDDGVKMLQGLLS